MEFKHILSPVKIGNITLKSRLTHTKSGGGLDGSPRQFERSAAYYVSVAKAGAALVCMAVGTWPDCEGKRSVMSRLNMDDPEIQAGYTRMIAAVHRHGTLCTASLMNVEPQELSICELDKWDFDFKGDYNPNFKNKPTISLERLEGMIRDYVYQCGELKRIGFDGATFYMSYRAGILANAISPVLNRRTDRYGGSTLEERARLPLEVFRCVKEACGQDFLIEIQTSAEEEPPGYGVEYWLDFCKLCEGLVDIFQVRGWDGSYTHVTGFNSTKENPCNLKYAEAFKKRGIKGLVAPVGGFGDPETMERFLAEGRTDLIAMARAYIADNDLADKIKKGRPEDVTPCLRCMGKCDFPCCSVNPYYGLIKEPGLFPPAGSPKSVAVIGGGPAGMRAAMAAAHRGHKVTLFEKETELGGQLKFSRYPDFKWNLKDYLDWMIRQVKKGSADIRLGANATPELIRQENFDAIICALGSAPKSIPVKGADTARTWMVDDVYGRESELGKRVVVIGGGQSGCETALYLAKRGHSVTLLTRRQEIYTDNSHCIWGQVQTYINEPSLSVVEFAETTEIGDGYVIAKVKTNVPRRKLTFSYVDEVLRRQPPKPDPIPGYIYPEYPDVQAAIVPEPSKDGGESENPSGFVHPPEAVPHIDDKDIIIQTLRIDCDSVVVSGGRMPRREEAKGFSGLAPAIYVVGDNVRPGSVQECTLTGFAAAMEL